MIDAFELAITTEDQKHFHVEIELIDNDHIKSNQWVFYKVLKEDTFPIQITPWPDSTDVQELIRIAVRIYQKQIKRNEIDGKS